jgi:hypothetical protein
MHPDHTALERAFQLAQSGRFSTLDELLRALRNEGFGTKQIDGPLLRKQLRTLLAGAKNRATSGG